MVGFGGFRTWFLQIELLLFFLFQPRAQTAIMPPPWANPKLNPCAAQPSGWQLLFWPPDGKCYKIFQVGHPCPDGMELSPSLSKTGQSLSAECRCTPEKAQSAADGICYTLFSAGPCQMGYYFGPDNQYKSENSKRQWGVCKQIKTCSDETLLYWPKDGKCYEPLSRGPCPKGQLLTTDGKIAFCKCDNQPELKDYKFADGQCYQHFTKGPCLEKGHLFLPDKTCGCHNYLPHYHEDSEQCFELGTIGPCAQGQLYLLNPDTQRATCGCKPGYIQHRNSTACYRPYTRGPCPVDNILINSTTCLPQPCDRGHLYFPHLGENSCYRIGTRGPCPANEIVTFDFNTRPSLDGISYNGLCACERKDCRRQPTSNEANERRIRCDRSKGMILFGRECHKMYTQGPCFGGAWLVPKRREGRGVFEEGSGTCECIPGYARSVRRVGRKSVTVCMSPTMMLAEYLNENYATTRRVR